MIWYSKNGNTYQTWTCTEDDFNCEGTYCEKYTLKVSTEGAVSDLFPVSDCKYGDTLKIQKVSGYLKEFSVYELVILGKPGT